MFSACGYNGGKPKADSEANLASPSDVDTASNIAEKVDEEVAKKSDLPETPAASGPSHRVTYFMLSKG